MSVHTTSPSGRHRGRLLGLLALTMGLAPADAEATAWDAAVAEAMAVVHCAIGAGPCEGSEPTLDDPIATFDAAAAALYAAAFQAGVADATADNADYVAGLEAACDSLAGAWVAGDCVPPPTPSLAGADLSFADLEGASLAHTVLAGANLYHADLEAAQLQGTILAGANLMNGYLPDADLTGADLSGATLVSTLMTGVDLTGADLRGADLSGTNLSGAVLAGAKLQDATFSGTNVMDVIWSNATCPDGTDSATHAQSCCGHLGGVWVAAGCD